ncbi:MAG: hypothetical protein GY788_14765 [bacterium]|nr:hypothetical protein [bacterium]
MSDVGDQLRVYFDSVISEQPDPADMAKELVAEDAAARPMQEPPVGGSVRVSGADNRPARRESWSGPWVAAAVFVSVLAIGGLLWLLAPFGTGSSPVAEPNDLPAAGPDSWPGFELVFVAGPNEESGRVIWVDTETWRVERSTQPDPNPGVESIIANLESEGETERAATLRALLDLDTLQVFFSVGGNATTVGSVRDPDNEGTPLSLFTAAASPQEAIEALAAGESIEVTPAIPTHPLAESAVVATSKAGTIRAEFTDVGIPVLVESSNPAGPSFRAESITPTSFDWMDVVSPRPEVRQHAIELMPLVSDDVSSLLADGVVTFAEYRDAVDATIDCVRRDAPEVSVLGPTYDAASGNFEYELSHTSSAVLDTADAVHDGCYNKYVDQIVGVWMLQFAPTDETRLAELAEQAPSEVDIEIAKAEPTEPVPVAEGDGWSLNAYRKGPALCLDFETPYGGSYGCVPPLVWDVPIFLSEGSGERDGVPNADLHGTVSLNVTEVVLEFPDGHTIELQPTGANSGFPVNFVAHTIDPSEHGLPTTAIAYNNGTPLDQLDLFDHQQP